MPNWQSVQRAAQVAVAVCFGELIERKIGTMSVVLGSTKAKHQMGEIKIKFVWRDVRAFCHEAHVTEGARIHDGFVIVRRNRIEFARRRIVDQVE